MMGYSELIAETDEILEMLQLCADSGLLSEEASANHAKAILKAQEKYKNARDEYNRLGSQEWGEVMPKKKKRKNPLWWIKG